MAYRVSNGSRVPRTWAWDKIEKALSLGPAGRALVADELYGETGERELASAGQLLKRLVYTGHVLRVGYGMYALPDKTDGLEHHTADSLERVLKVQPLTVQQACEMFGAAEGTIHWWLIKLRRKGILWNARAPKALWSNMFDPRTGKHVKYPCWQYWIPSPKQRTNRGRVESRWSKQEVASWPEGQKRCNTCLQLKPFEQFTAVSGGLLGRHPRCNRCRADEANLKYHRNPARQLQSNARYREKVKAAPHSDERKVRNAERARRWYYTNRQAVLGKKRQEYAAKKKAPAA